MKNLLLFPFYIKASLMLIGTYVFVSMLYVGQDIILPVIYATIIAILISPIVNFMVRKKMNRAVSIAIVLVFSLTVILSTLVLVVSQASLLSEAIPKLGDKIQELLTQSAAWTSGYFKISPEKINQWIINGKLELKSNSHLALGSTISTAGGILTTLLLTPVYIFMLLFYQTHIIEFIHRLVGAANDNKVREILAKTKLIIRSYLVGLFIEMGIVAILNSIGLLVLGIEYAVLLGIMGALLNIIPYLGGLITMVLFMVIALLTKSPEYVLYVLVLYTVIQLIDNNYVVPKIVGSKVKLNALISIITVIGGAALWGIPGMFLSIPITAIAKVIFDRIDTLTPWGFLLGDTMPPMVKLQLPFTSVSKTIKDTDHEIS